MIKKKTAVQDLQGQAQVTALIEMLDRFSDYRGSAELRHKLNLANVEARRTLDTIKCINEKHLWSKEL